MIQLKLIKGLSYTGEVKATKKKPYVTADEATAKQLVASGYFTVVGTPEKAEKKPTAPEETVKDEPEKTDSEAAADGAKKATAKSKK